MRTLALGQAQGSTLRTCVHPQNVTQDNASAGEVVANNCLRAVWVPPPWISGQVLGVGCPRDGSGGILGVVQSEGSRRVINSLVPTLFVP